MPAEAEEGRWFQSFRFSLSNKTFFCHSPPRHTQGKPGIVKNPFCRTFRSLQFNKNRLGTFTASAVRLFVAQFSFLWKGSGIGLYDRRRISLSLRFENDGFMGWQLLSHKNLHSWAMSMLLWQEQVRSTHSELRCEGKPGALKNRRDHDEIFVRIVEKLLVSLCEESSQDCTRSYDWKSLRLRNNKKCSGGITRTTSNCKTSCFLSRLNLVRWMCDEAGVVRKWCLLG